MTTGNYDLKSGNPLPVLQRASHDDLLAIADALNRSWDVRIKADARYRRAAHDLTIIPQVLADYLTRAGGHAMVNWWRSAGPGYAEVVHDVCGVMKVKVQKQMSILAMEETLLRVIMERVWDAMSEKEREEAVRSVEAQWEKAGRRFDRALGSKLWTLSFAAFGAQVGLRMTGFLTYQVAVQIANMAARQVLGRGLAFAANAALTRAIAVAIGPVGWAASAAWLVVDALGPSYRGVAPAVFQVAALRQQFLWDDEEDFD